MNNMIEIKTENWNGNEIRFVYIDGEWNSVLKDVCDALDLKVKKVIQNLKDEYEDEYLKGVLIRYPLLTNGGEQELYICKEELLYEIVFKSRKQEAKEFKRWVFKMIKELRTVSGLEGLRHLK